MKDYAVMSDFEINKLVAVANGYHHDDCDIAKLNNPMVGVEWDDDTGYATKTLDYCNNAEDAWPIIAENGITLAFQDGNWWADNLAYWVDGVEWNIGGIIDKNPLRAAMIVFLMMKEGE